MIEPQSPAPRDAGVPAAEWAIPGVEFARSGTPVSPIGFRLGQVLEAIETDFAELAELAGSDFSDDDGYGLIAAETRLRAPSGSSHCGPASDVEPN